MEAIMDGLCALWKGTLQLKWPRVSASVQEQGNTAEGQGKAEQRGCSPCTSQGLWIFLPDMGCWNFHHGLILLLTEPCEADLPEEGQEGTFPGKVREAQPFASHL